MKRDGITSYLVSHPPDYYYLTGFTGEDSAVLIQPKRVHVISDSRFDESINQECPWVRRWMRKQSLNDEIANVCGKLKIKALALQPDRVSLASHKFIKKHAKGTRLVHAGSMIAPMRSCKEPGELAAMQRAIDVAEASFKALRKTLRVGQTELEVAARLEYEMKTGGASGAAFGTICAEGPNAALPHAHAGSRKLKKGSALLVDWGARVGNYCSDLTRVLFIGSIPRKLGEVYRIVLEAQQSAIDAIRPGAKMCDVDAVARDFIKNAGYGDYFGHGLGHGLGLEVHEPPSLSWRSDEPMAEGMVVTVEPGIYLPGVGGVRIEDDVLVTAKGAKVLSSLDRSLAGSVV
jgi:Xaa-Pro aminopeptidase